MLRFNNILIIAALIFSTSTVVTGEVQSNTRPHLVFISAENEYEADRTLPEFGQELEKKYNFTCQVLQGSTKKAGMERNNIPGMEALEKADLVVLFVRRRALPEKQMKYFKDYLNRGKPLIALRTSSHAFALKGKLAKISMEGLVEWKNFDREVLGCNYNGYPHGETVVSIASQASGHPVLKGLKGPYQVRETMYQNRPLAPTCKVLLTGKCVDGGKGKKKRYRLEPGKKVQDEPVAWVNRYKKSRIFYTLLGSGRASFKEPWFRRMLVNAVFWALDTSIKNE